MLQYLNKYYGHWASTKILGNRYLSIDPFVFIYELYVSTPIADSTITKYAGKSLMLIMVGIEKYPIK